MRKISIGFGIASLVALGCGGSSPATSGYPTGGTTPANVPAGPGTSAGAALLTYKSGNSWTYKVSGTLSREFYDIAGSRKSENGEVSGTMVRTISSATFAGTACLKVVDAYSYSITGGSTLVYNQIRYVVQAGDSSVTVIGYHDQDVDFVANAASASVPGAYASGVSVANSGRFGQSAADYQADKSVEESFTVSAQDSVTSSVKGSPFTAWKVATNLRDVTNVYPVPRVVGGIILPKGFVTQSTKSQSGTEYWLPQFGAPVSIDMSLNQIDSVLTSWTYTSGTFTRTDDTLKTIGSLRLTLQSSSLS
jgi:hypothetical protein